MRPEEEYRAALRLVEEGVNDSETGVFRYPRGVYRLRVVRDLRYPDIVNEIATHTIIASGIETVGFRSREGRVEVSSYWKDWISLFPQHGQGRKHERPIELTTWQQRIVDVHPKALIGGLIQSDGNRHVNEVTRKTPLSVPRATRRMGCWPE
ncbi:MAG: hypothetical protein PVG83_11370 [Acidimicrobiia bacterium]|jgi:hypothetical protein